MIEFSAGSMYCTASKPPSAAQPQPDQSTADHTPAVQVRVTTWPLPQV